MTYSTTTLVKLQRLARAAKKELNLVTKLSSESGVAALMSRVSMAHDNNTIVVLFEDFKSTLTGEDEAMLSSSGVIHSSLPMLDDVETEQRVKIEAEVKARIQAEADAQVKLKVAALEKAKAPTEKLIKFPKDATAPVVKPARKQIGTYRGQPVYENIE